MISIRQIYKRDINLCYELDSKTIGLWSKNQWDKEFKKKGIKVFGLSLSNLVVGICVYQVILDEVQINFFAVDEKYRSRGLGSYLMNNLIKQCETLKIKKLFLEVSRGNITAERFYSRFAFYTVGGRKNYYRDGSDALLKEKNITTK